MSETTVATLTAVACHCRFAGTAPAHHSQLVRAAIDVTVAVELLELAVTWDELDYSQEELIPPAEWLDFAADHGWHEDDLASRLFSVAVDIVNRRGEGAGAAN